MTDVVAPVVPKTDYSFTGVAPTNDDTGGGLKLKLPPVATPVADRAPSASSWDPSPDEVQKNKESAQIHEEVHGPVVRDIIKGTSPTATPEDREKVVKHLNAKDFNVPAADQTRWGELFGAIGKSDWGKVNAAWNGGQDKYEEGRDALNNKYWKVFNQRGELRRIENENFKPLTPEEEKAIGGITTKGDISPSFGAGYDIKRLNARDIQVAQSGLFNKVMSSQEAASRNAEGIADAAKNIRVIAPQLYSSSPDAATRAYIAGIHNIGTGNTKEIQTGVNVMHQMEKGNQVTNSSDLNTAKNIGLKLGLHYGEDKQWRDQNGTVVSGGDLDKRANDLMQRESSKEAIDARKEDLEQKAAILFAKDPKKLALVTQYIDSNYQVAQAQKEIEDAGGLPGIKPVLPPNLMEGYYAGDVKAVHNQAYGEIATRWAQFVQEKRAQLPTGTTPDVSSWMLEFNKNPEIKAIKKNAADEILKINSQIPTTPTVEGPVNPRLVTNSSASTPSQKPSEATTSTEGETKGKPTVAKKLSAEEERKAKLRKSLGAE